MAEAEIKNTVELGAATSEDGKPTETPSVDELMTQLALERAEKEKNKAALDKALKENGEVKRQLRTKMTAEEQESEAKKEQEAARNKEIADMRAELATIRATKQYMALKMDEKFAEETAKAFVSGDYEKVNENLAKHIKAIELSAEERGRSTVLKERPDINAGNGSADKNAFANERAIASARRTGGVNTDILKQYGVGGKK